MTLVLGLVLVIAGAAIGALMPVQYVSLGPGPTFNTLGRIKGRPIIQVAGRATNHTTGNLNLTTVSVLDQLDIFSALRGWVEADHQVVPREVFFPPGQTTTQANRQQHNEYVSSQNSAVAAALRQLGYPLKVVVTSVPKGSPSMKKLRVDDVVSSVDGTAVTAPDGLQKAVRTHHPGDVLTVGYSRLGKPGSVRVVAGSNKGTAVLGITIALQRAAPFDVSIQAPTDIGGPSGGLMFALAIMDSVGPTDLTGGRFIAGTGTIDNNGKVGEIGGIPLKMLAARGAGAVAFLVPAANCSEAQSHHPAGLRLIRVGTLAGAISALRELRSGSATPSC